MSSLLELLVKASAPPPPHKDPPELPEPFRTIDRALYAANNVLESFMAAMEAPARILSNLGEALQREPWKSITNGIIEVVQNWPTDQYGRPLELEEFHYGFAAVAAVEEAVEAPKAADRDKALDEFLLKDARFERGRQRLGLGLDPQKDGQLEIWRQTLWQLVTEHLAQPVSETDNWVFDSERCYNQLRVEMIGKFGRAKDLWEDQTIEDEPWTAANLHWVRKKKKERLPNLCKFDAEQHAGVEEDPAETIGLTNADLMEMLTEFQKREQEKFYLRQLEGLMPEQEHRVLSLKVEHPTWTYRQIASEMGCSKSTVKTCTQRTRERVEETPEIKELVEGLM